MGNVVRLRPGPRPLDDGRACLRLFPVSPLTIGKSRAAFIYAVGFEDGITKIGMTLSPRERVMAHWRTIGRRLAWAHLFSPILDPARCGEIERQALRNCAAVGKRILRTESFEGLPREAALRCVRAALAAPDEPIAKAA